mmetsp:Transcript_28999/g.72326  ORF Transcript_28999/g.72326 Transcript_28999/m.72326 type:complete len:211 (-) Transcript_28999:108-740(-)
MERGSISMCVYIMPRSPDRSASETAISAEFSSFTSRYSMIPSRTKSSHERSPRASWSICTCSSCERPRSTMTSGRHTRPESEAMLTQRWLGCSCTETNSPRWPARRSWRIVLSRRWGWRWSPRISPFKKTRCPQLEYTSSAHSICMSSTPRLKHSLRIGSSSSSVVTCVDSARFLTSPHASPSGVSEGQSIPHCDGCSERGPLTFRVFSN